MRHLYQIILLIVFIGTIQPAFAQQVPQYEAKMMRLAEILGSLHYLRNLCGENTNLWRDRMNELVEAEEPTPGRRARLYAAFNDAYRGFSSNYNICTTAAINADKRYLQEGVNLSAELLKRYGN